MQDNLEQPDGIAVDWVHQNLYFSDADRNVIEVTPLGGDGTMRKTIAKDGLDMPRALAVDPRNG